MVGTSSSSSSSCASFSSFDEVTDKAASVLKLLCSYGGKILPRYPDGKLRYVGGETRVLAVDRSIPFSELQVKLGELCGWPVATVRCQLPREDLDALVSVTSDEDLANLCEEYDLASRDRLIPLKIRAFLFPPSSPSSKPLQSSPPPSIPTTPIRPKDSSSYCRPPISNRCFHQMSAAALGRFPSHIAGIYGHSHQPQHHHPAAVAHGNSKQQHRYQYLVHHGNHRQ